MTIQIRTATFPVRNPVLCRCSGCGAVQEVSEASVGQPHFRQSEIGRSGRVVECGVWRRMK